MASPGDAKETTPTSESNHIELLTATNLDTEGTKITEVTTSPQHVEKYSENDDEAMKAMAIFDGEPLIMDKATNRRLLRKIDWHLMPVM